MKVRLLPPPAQAPLAHGDARGGIFDAPWLPADFIGPGYAPMPIDSSTAQRIAPSVVGVPMAWGSTMPTQGAGVGNMWEMVGPAPIAIPQFQPIQRRYRGGIFRGVGQVERVAVRRPEWTRWQLVAAARARQAAGYCP